MKKVLALVLAIACVMSIGFVSAFAAPADGTYSVPIKCWKETRDEKSMADVLGDNATVTVANGQITMTVTTKQMEMYGIKGDLVGLKVSDGNGGYIDATPTGTNADGNPTGYTFPVAASDYDSGYIKIKEKAKLTPTLPMQMPEDARIKIYTDQATQTAAPTTSSSSSSSSNIFSQLFSRLTSLFNK